MWFGELCVLYLGYVFINIGLKIVGLFRLLLRNLLLYVSFV